MRKHFHIIAVIIALLLMPSFVFAGTNSFGAAKAVSSGDNLVVVPLEITNRANLTALDIPLKFSEGVTLMEVNFINTRVEYFDLKIANINNEENTVVIGLLPQMTPAAKPDLEAGSGVIANLVFEINDKTLNELTLEAISTENPNHELTFVYHEFNSEGVRSIGTVTADVDTEDRIDFESVTVSLLGTKSVPESYELSQNYPNPFNPATNIAFALPEASHVKLSVYNVLGQEVTTLRDELMEAGKHIIAWDAGDRASGIYFYRITAENFSQTKKMMLLK